jgi:hypothetical protein
MGWREALPHCFNTRPEAIERIVHSDLSVAVEHRQPDWVAVLFRGEEKSIRLSRALQHEQNKRRNARGVLGVSFAELPAHDRLLEPEFAPEGGGSDRDGEHSPPFAYGERRSDKRDEKAGVDRMADQR